MSWAQLPPELWEKILDDVDAKGLESAQSASRAWNRIIITYVGSGRVRNRARVCERLNHGDSAAGAAHLDHRRGIKNRVRVAVSTPVLFLGFGVYTERDELIADEQAHGTFDRTTDTVSVYTAEEKRVAEVEQISTIADLRKGLRDPWHIPHTMTVWDQPCVLRPGENYELEHNLRPTDVINHLSGWPVTVTGAEVWTCCGSGGEDRVTSHDVTFLFSKSSSSRGGGLSRCCLREGQIPYLRFWKL